MAQFLEKYGNGSVSRIVMMIVQFLELYVKGSVFEFVL